MGYHDHRAQTLRTITTWVACQRDVDNLNQEEPRTAPWWKPWRHRTLRKNLAELTGRHQRALICAENDARPLLPEAAETLLDEVTHKARTSTGRHTFHPEILDPETLTGLASSVSDEALAAQVGGGVVVDQTTSPTIRARW